MVHTASLFAAMPIRIAKSSKNFSAWPQPLPCAATHRGNIVDRALADATLALPGRIGVQLGVEGLGGPIHEAQVVYFSVEPSRNRTEAEDASHCIQIEILDADIGRQRRRDTKRTLHHQPPHIQVPGKTLT